jgi:hypothetical protein
MRFVATKSLRRHETAFGPKQTFVVAPHMSAFGGKADMVRTCEIGRK